MTKELDFDIIFDHQKLVYLLLKQIKVETTTSKSEVLNTTATTFIPTTKQENTTNSTTTAYKTTINYTTENNTTATDYGTNSTSIKINTNNSEVPTTSPGKLPTIVIACVSSLVALVAFIFLVKFLKRKCGGNSGISALFCFDSYFLFHLINMQPLKNYNQIIIEQ